MNQTLQLESSDFEEITLPNSIKAPKNPDLPTVNCMSEWHEDVSESRMLREGQRVVVLLYRTDSSNVWTVETIRCIRCGTSFPSYDESLVPESEVAVVSGTLTTTESERALQLINTQCLDSYVVGEDSEKTDEKTKQKAQKEKKQRQE